jgi:hypothetical protein
MANALALNPQEASMPSWKRVIPCFVFYVFAVFISGPAEAEIGDQLSAYTSANAKGYLAPLKDAFGTDLNSGLFYSADVPVSGIHISLEFRAMVAFFGDDDRTFHATTEGGFTPQQTTEAPTVAGPGKAIGLVGSGGTEYYFPGGFDLSSFGLVVPQLRIGSIHGTEALARFFALDAGDSELGKIRLYGFGLQHSISQYLGPALPLDLSAMFFWQEFKLGKNDAGDDLLTTSAFSFGAQASKNLGIVQPYGGLSLETFSMKANYTSDVPGETGTIDLDYATTSTVRLTAGVSLSFYFLRLNAEYSFSSMNSFGFGLAMGNL